jgi:hypothetical protein
MAGDEPVPDNAFPCLIHRRHDCISSASPHDWEPERSLIRERDISPGDEVEIPAADVPDRCSRLIEEFPGVAGSLKNEAPVTRAKPAVDSGDPLVPKMSHHVLDMVAMVCCSTERSSRRAIPTHSNRRYVPGCCSNSSHAFQQDSASSGTARPGHRRRALSGHRSRALFVMSRSVPPAARAKLALPKFG